MRDKEMDKAMRDYDKAWSKLITLRNDRWPVGTKYRCRLTGYTGEIKQGSLYADQVNTTMGHFSWRYLEKIDE